MLFLPLLAIAQLIEAAPIPALITRYHTAAAVTTTKTYVTGTTTVYLPPVELFISNGVSYTFTLSEEQWNTYPMTTTRIYNNNQQIMSKPAETTQAAQAQETAETQPAQETQATTPSTQAPAPPVETTPPTTSTTPIYTPPTTSTTPLETPEAPITTDAAETQPTQETQATTPSTQEPQETPQETQNTETFPETTAQTTSSTFTTSTSTTSTSTTSTFTTSTSTTYTPSTSTTSTTSATNDGLISPPTAIVYSPYQNDGSCKDVSTISSDLELIHSKGINNIRVYGTDCNNFVGILPKCAELGMKVNQGVWFTPAGGVSSIDGSVSDIIAYGEANGWGVFDFITIGNEAINDGYLTVSELIGKISSVKSQLQSAGYTGKVTTSEPPVSFSNHPELCTNSDIDIVGINPHAYFNAAIDASQAGAFIKQQKEMVEGVCGSKEVLITETGYPSQGNTNGLNVPSAENQKIAIQSIIEQTGGSCTILTTYNDFWKQPGPYGIEQYFGTITLFN